MRLFGLAFGVVLAAGASVAVAHAALHIPDAQQLPSTRVMTQTAMPVDMQVGQDPLAQAWGRASAPVGLTVQPISYQQCANECWANRLEHLSHCNDFRPGPDVEICVEQAEAVYAWCISQC